MLCEKSKFERELMSKEELKAEIIKGFTLSLIEKVEKKIKEVGKEEFYKKIG